jgi:predicted porin
MQKKLLTLAVAGALAAPGLALAQVEVYGFVNMSVGKFKYSDSASGSPSVSKWDVASHASNYGIRGRENLGGGQTAWFQIEQNAPLERSNNVAITPASRNSAVGMQGGWGNIFIGQWTTPWADLDGLWGVGTVGGWGPITSIIGRRETTGTAPNPNCANALSPGVGACDAVEAGGGVGHAFWRRVSQAVFYQSPVFGGVQLKFAYQTNDGKATQTTGGVVAADPSLWSGSVQWAGMGGRVRVGAAMDAHKDFTTIGQTDNGFRVTGGWNFGVADIGVAYERMTYKSAAGDVEAKQIGIGVAVPIGSGAIRASYAFAKDLTGPGVTAAIDDAGAKTWNIGYDYRFSKRTTVGVGFAKIVNDTDAVFTWTGAPPTQTGGAVTPANVPLPGSDPSTFFVNMLHRF